MVAAGAKAPGGELEEPVAGAVTMEAVEETALAATDAEARERAARVVVVREAPVRAAMVVPPGVDWVVMGSRKMTVSRPSRKIAENVMSTISAIVAGVRIAWWRIQRKSMLAQHCVTREWPSHARDLSTEALAGRT